MSGCPEYLELLSPEAITAEEFHRNVLWLRSWLRSTGAK
jgi:hypothetical protein